jgi:uncharacterized protein YjbI with pentapeptide repeats
MVQALWYVRKSGAVRGPFPAHQIIEAMHLGEIAESDEISLDAELWLTVKESGVFPPGVATTNTHLPTIDPAWLAEREKARTRWEQGEAIGNSAGTVPADDDPTRLEARRASHAMTRNLVDDQSSRRPSYMIGLLALLCLGGLAALIWYGQGDDAIQASIGKVAECAARPAPGVSWAGCDKTGMTLAKMDLHNMTLSRSRLDGAVLVGANLSYVDLSRASLRGADLSGSNLLGAKLDGADLTGADLSRSDLRYATFTKTLVEGLKLDGAVFGKTVWTMGQLCDSMQQCL